MVTTTIGVDDGLLDELEEKYRHPEHASWNEFLRAITMILPELDDIQEGCSNPDCDRTLYRGGPVEDWGGVIYWFSHEYDGATLYHQAYYCGPECAQKVQDEVNAMVPENPDLVVIGGKDEMRSEVEGASFYLDGERREVSVPVPGAFGGSDGLGNEYDYEGEPVYIKNRGEWVQTGVIDDIIHEEAHTALVLDHGNHAMLQENHPDDDVREDYLERQIVDE